MKTTDQELEKLACKHYEKMHESTRKLIDYDDYSYGFEDAYRQAETDTFNKVLELLRDEPLKSLLDNRWHGHNWAEWLETKWKQDS